MRLMKFYPSAKSAERFTAASFAALVICAAATGCGKKSETEAAAVPEEAIAVTSESPEPAAAPTSPARMELVAAPAAAPEVAEEKIDLTGTNYVVNLEGGETPVVEGRIYEIAISDQPPRAKAEALLALMPRLVSDEQRKVAAVALHQISDADYDLVQPQLMNAALDSKVLDVFLADALKRRNETKMPMLLELTRAEEHPLQPRARQMLSNYLGKDFGTNWVRWENGITAWLSKNPG
jgi:hypothetical protein